MAKLSNTPKQTLTFDLERRKSYTFRVALKYGDGLPVDLTGSQVTFVMKESALDDDPRISSTRSFTPPQRSVTPHQA